MEKSKLEELRALFPHLTDDELAASYERLRRYIRVGLEILRSSGALTSVSDGGSVEAGQVEPRTFKNTG